MSDKVVSRLTAYLKTLVWNLPGVLKKLRKITKPPKNT
jgi:hypothetical protein